MKQLFTALAISATMSTAWLVSASAHATEKPQAIAISYVTAPFNVPSIVMRQKGFLDEAFAAHGIQLSHPVITSGAAQTQAVAAGKVQIASVLGGTSAILAHANGADVVVIGAYARAPKAYTIMALAQGPLDVKALRGKKVAGPKGTVLNQLLAAALRKEGMDLDDIQYLNMDLPAARAALLAGKVDAATLAGQHVTQIEKAGGHMVTNGEGLIMPTTVIGANKTFALQHPELLKAYFGAHLKALAFMHEHPQEALQLAAQEQKISLEDARQQLALYDFNPEISDADVKNLSDDQQFMVEVGMLEKERQIDIRKDLILPQAFHIR